jgi:phosphatidylserine decarboxylase
MNIHKEGYKTIGIAGFLFIAVNIILFIFSGKAPGWITGGIFVLTLLGFLFIVSFFRIPKRAYTINDDVICPADGRVVVIEEIFEDEYFHDKRLQVSIFMSPANVHVNRNPITGIVQYSQYHKGKYLVAWHPKSSTENERHSVVIENQMGVILVKQIAGALAKRIKNYLSVGEVIQGKEMGFIKFGSRVDVILPLNAVVKVKLNQKVRGGMTVLASFHEHI